MKFYHYTTKDHHKEILDSGNIKLSESNVSPFKEHAGPDVVWLFKDPIANDKEIPNMLIGEINLAGIPVGATSKTDFEFVLDLPLEEVTRADKWFKKQKADQGWISVLEKNGGCKFTKQYVIERMVEKEAWLEVNERKDLQKTILFNNAETEEKEDNKIRMSIPNVKPKDIELLEKKLGKKIPRSGE